jgi:tRNA(fMet)-specific endonuclease VapC
MLDTDSISYSWRGEGEVGVKILQHPPSDLCVSAITIAELRYGADRRKSNKLHEKIDKLIRTIEVVPFNEIVAGHFGTIASTLAAEGMPIGEFDVMIAATALAAQATLVTNNVQHFKRVRGLRVENWY